MKNLILFVIAILIATGAFLAALTMSNPLPAYLFGFGVMGLFMWRLNYSSNKASRRRQQERLFSEWLRSQERYRRHF